jgi:hypothetical protein
MADNPFVRFVEEGFIKTGDTPRVDLRQEAKVGLNRKGNELFNSGEIESARRLFQTTGYSDGLIRVGDRYMEESRPVDALKMYWLAKDRRRSGELIEKIARIIQNFLAEEAKNGGGSEQRLSGG